MAHSAGVDWGGTAHAVRVVDAGRRTVARCEVAHTAASLAGLRRELAVWGGPGALRVAIERPSGLLVDALVEAGRPVVPIHPSAAKAARPRHRMSGAKSDGADSYLLADLLRTDGHRSRPLVPASDEVKALRALVRGRDDLVAARVRLANQLRAVLEGHWPGAAAVFAAADSPIALAIIRRYPTPGSAGGLGEKHLAGFLAQHGHFGRRSAGGLLGRLRAAPGGVADGEEEDARGEVAVAPAATPERLLSRIALLTSRVRHAVAALPCCRFVMSFPRAGRVCATQIAAELGGARERFLRAEALAMEAGVAPLTRRSGESRSVVSRWACNKRPRAAVTCFADNSRRASPWATTLRARARGRGCGRPHAIRVLARA